MTPSPSTSPSSVLPVDSKTHELLLAPVSDKQGFFDVKSTAASGMADPLVSPRPHLEERKSFAPKTPVELAPPKDDPISYEQLKEADGMQEQDISQT